MEYWLPLSSAILLQTSCTVYLYLDTFSVLSPIVFLLKELLLLTAVIYRLCLLYKEGTFQVIHIIVSSGIGKCSFWLPVSGCTHGELASSIICHSASNKLYCIPVIIYILSTLSIHNIIKFNIITAQLILSYVVCMSAFQFPFS